jgi:hypothetical protein
MKDRLRKTEPDLPLELACFHPTNPAIVAYRQALGDPDMAPLEHWIAVARFYDIPQPAESSSSDSELADVTPISGPVLVRRKSQS